MSKPAPRAIPATVELPDKVIGVARKKGSTDICLVVNTNVGQVHVDMEPAGAAQLIAGLAKAMTETIDDLGQQLVEWIGVG
ncbi:MAG TPA: hypothetical protein VGS97_20015 [Actinocrinis sp.]|uniref:hypothetical protein n=1 Tax=Actinocrinis sp. TaxID=1920516 RepID=UPI002DDDBC1C|nr:hypothetical protein [Actinocrinis sp.]HEV2346395.1 hypothetical protein [Actinocrinis sp.]